MQIVFWGTYDTGKPRVRILLKGLRENGCRITECHANVWEGIEDKTRVTGWIDKLKLGIIWLSSYPRLILHYMRLPRHEAVIIGYLGNLDLLVLWPFARLRGIALVWDAFLSLYETAVEDREMFKPSHPVAFFLWGLDWLACRAADLVIFDTQAHADYFEATFGISREKTSVVFVGAETDLFTSSPPARNTNSNLKELELLFYGQFIPLHGIETIIQAAQLLQEEPVKWLLIGRGQREEQVREILQTHPLPKLKWIPWVPYSQLPSRIYSADICLGIFGSSGKASRVIPNKVFQIIACGKPLITRDSPAIRELIDPDANGVCLVPPADPEALAQAVRRLQLRPHPSIEAEKMSSAITPNAVGAKLLNDLENLVVNPKVA